MGLASALQLFSASALQCPFATVLPLIPATVLRLLFWVPIDTFSHLREVPSFVLPMVSPRF